MGCREPTAWQGALALASQLLMTGGLLLQYDMEKWGEFADVEVMEACVEANSLGLKLKECSEPTRPLRRRGWKNVSLVVGKDLKIRMNHTSVIVIKCSTLLTKI